MQSTSEYNAQLKMEQDLSQNLAQILSSVPDIFGNEIDGNLHNPLVLQPESKSSKLDLPGSHQAGLTQPENPLYKKPSKFI